MVIDKKKCELEKKVVQLPFVNGEKFSLSGNLLFFQYSKVLILEMLIQMKMANAYVMNII